MMSKDLQDLLCNCSSGSIGNSSNANKCQKNYHNFHDIKHPTSESDGDDKLLNNWKTLDDDSWDVISALRQKFCQLSKSEAQSATARESPHSLCTYSNRQIFERRSLVERASDSIDYTPESEFLRKIKQQCQYLQNRLPNIFTTLNDCFPENEINECQKCFLLKSKAQLSNGRSWKCCNQQPDLPYRDKKMRMKRSSIFQRPCTVKESYSHERLKVDEKKSDHISRSKKRDRSRRFRKRKSNVSPTNVGVLENEFEPSLKKPNENSCERCWRFASPARSPVNKPDQRFDPNFRRGHSTTSIPKGEGDGDDGAESVSPDVKGERNTSESIDKEIPCSRRTCDTTSRSPVNGSHPHAAPHICTKQKMEAAGQTGAKECPKHGNDSSPPVSPFRNEYEQFPLPNQKKCCFQPRPFRQRTPSPPRMQHMYSKDMDSLQQHDPCKLRPNIKCPVEPERGPSWRRTQKISLQHESPHRTSPEHICLSPRSPQQKCCEQTSPCFGHTCNHTSPKAHSQRPQSCGQGSKRRSPCRIEDVDLTEYRDIFMNKKKENCIPCSYPCGRSEGFKKTSPCGPFLKMSKPGDRCKMETIPEVPTKKIEEDECESKKDKSECAPYRNNRGSTSGSESRTTKQPKSVLLDSKGRSTPKDFSAKSGSDRSDPSKKPTKKDKSSGKGNPPKKSPDKGKSGVKVRGGRGTSGKKVRIGSAGFCGDKKPSEFDKAHPIRSCRCPPRMSETDESPESCTSPGQTLCCHCDWDEEAKNQLKFLTQIKASKNRSQECYCKTSCQDPSPERLSPIPKDGAMECPYRAYANKFGPGGIPLTHCDQEEDNHRFSRETPSEYCAQEIFHCTPRKYFMFYMTQERDKTDSNLEVLVEELGQGCPKNEPASRTKDIKEKMKKINEPPPDSMALRFQKGVTEGCNVPQSSRILYF